MIFIFPTETAYGLGCNACSAAAVKKIFAIKGRGGAKTFPLIAADVAMVKKCVAVGAWKNSAVQKIIKKWWPGALTLVLPANAYAKKVLAPQVVAEDGTIAIRVSGHPLACGLARIIGAPIVATSANAAGAPACYSVAAVKKSLQKNMSAQKNFEADVDFIFDCGALPKNPPSTIVRFTNGHFEILRAGAIKL